MIRKRLFSIAYMFGLTLFFTAVVTGIYQVNQQRIAINEEIKLQKVVLQVLGIELEPEATGFQVKDTFESRVKLEEREERVLYRGFMEDGKTLIGYAFPLFGAGFWGPIYGVIGVDPELEKVIGIAFYRHAETPGLGGRITETWFQDQFPGKRLRPPGEGQRYFYLVSPGTSKAENELDAITGATGTSRGVERFVDENLRDYLPWIAQEKEAGRV
jgi:Na+-transporting NADH:ubiquinone oxidoreductase subunit C